MVPFVADKTEEAHEDVIQIAKGLHFRVARNKQRKVIKRVLFLGQDDLATASGKGGLPDDSVLYITCHGNPKVIGPMSNDINIGPSDLAALIKKHVPRNLAHLKIMTCNSGVHYGNATSFVSKLCTELAPDFPKLIVYGYTGYTGEKGNKSKHSYVTTEHGGGKEYVASKARVAVTGVTAEPVEHPDINTMKETWQLAVKVTNSGTTPLVEALPMGAHRSDVDVETDD
jgi:hypothetical protein